MPLFLGRPAILVSFIAALTISETAGQTARKAVPSHAANSTLNSSQPILFGLVWFRLQLAFDLPDVIALVVNRQAIYFDRIFDHDPGIGGQGLRRC